MSTGLKRLTDALGSVGNLQKLDNIINESPSIVDVFVYDTSKDSDGGAWRFGSVTRSTSWYNEALGTATRGMRKEFPSIAIIVAETTKITIYDADDPLLPMWMVFDSFNSDAFHVFLSHKASLITSVCMKNGVLAVGKTYIAPYYGHLRVANFASDIMTKWTGYYNTHFISPVGISLRNDTSVGFYPTSDTNPIPGGLVNGNINDVAITTLPYAPIDPITNLPIPTIAVATNGGVSVIKDDGNVVNITFVSTFPTKINFISGGKIGFIIDYAGLSRYYAVYDIPASSIAESFGIGAIGSSSYYFNSQESGTGFSLPHTLPNYVTASSGDAVITRMGMVKRDLTGFTYIIPNNSNPQASLGAYITSLYNTGYMVGDIRRAYLCNSLTADRSIKAGTLTMVGTVTETVNAGGVNVYSGFSGTNYLQEAANAEYDVGTGAFWLRAVIKPSAGTETIFDRRSSPAATTGILCDVSGRIPAITLGHIAAAQTHMPSTTVLSSTEYSAVDYVREANGDLKIYINGVLDVSSANDSRNLTDAIAVVNLGLRVDAVSIFGGSMALVRFGATAPTPAQIKLMYDQERHLFAAGAQALLSNDTITALAYDESTDKTYVGSVNAIDELRGLEVLNRTSHPASIKSISAANGFVAIGD